MTIRVVVVDDHPSLRRGTCGLLSEFPDVEVVGQAENGEEAIAVTRALLPDVVVMDLGLPDMHGAEVTRAIKKEKGGAKVLVFTSASSDEEILRALRSGADGYVIKTAQEDLLVAAIRLVAKGQTAILQPEVSQALVRNPHLQEALTQREREVLREVARDKGNKEIASVLQLSERTVEQHLRNVYEKLAVHSRTGAVLKAIQLGHLALSEIADS